MSPGGAVILARPLSRAGLSRAVRQLARCDPDLAGVVATHGPPPLWARRPGFPTLVRIVLEQQVSLASARAAYERLSAATGRVTPRAFLALDAARLRAIGFSRQKASYCRDIARGVVDGELDLRALGGMDDASCRARLERLRGVGRWTADIYLLMALRRPDVWPRGDLALEAAARRLKRLPASADGERLAALARSWKPWRSVAARILWHDYLSRRKQARRAVTSGARTTAATNRRRRRRPAASPR